MKYVHEDIFFIITKYKLQWLLESIATFNIIIISLFYFIIIIFHLLIDSLTITFGIIDNKKCYHKWEGIIDKCY